jgi:hypothetical protein
MGVEMVETKERGAPLGRLYRKFRGVALSDFDNNVLI